MLRSSMIAVALFFTSVVASAVPAFVNGIAIPGDTSDTFGATANDGRVGFFSDIYYDPVRDEWWGLSDRGPGGGTLKYDTRVQRFTVDIDPATGAISNFKIAETIKLTNGFTGLSMNGIAPSPGSVLGHALDPEGFVISPKNGNFLVSDEYGPSLYEFNRKGQLVRAFATPANLIPRDSVTGVANYAADPTTNPAGKRTNRGFEGLAVSPDGQYLYAMLQSAMLDEGGGNGTVNRIVKFDMDTGRAVAQYGYVMDASSQGRGVSALVAVSDTEFLVLERNNRGVGVGAEFSPPNKRVYKISMSGATDIGNITLGGATNFTPVAKSTAVFIDLGANTLPELGNKVPEKWEGLAIGPRLNDGSFMMLAGTDNDYSVTQNASGAQFDVYFRFSDADPYVGSIQCPLGTRTGCSNTTGGAAAVPTADHKLLPGVLHAYKIPEADLVSYIKPGTHALVTEFYNATLKHYFRTSNPVEARNIDKGLAGAGWQRTGDDFYAFPAAVGAAGSDVCRFYTAQANSHFLTASSAECAALKLSGSGWSYESVAFKAVVIGTNALCPAGMIPAYRVYNNRASASDSNHRFTTVLADVAALQAIGWVYEGVAFCALKNPDQ
ncbi:MAG: esterase-like activity of phytase family protein [Betaproteobacteria bacterium]|nr:esterase-like activity of phytase family protein [Betaproteobacteria bacterium]